VHASEELRPLQLQDLARGGDAGQPGRAGDYISEDTGFVSVTSDGLAAAGVEPGTPRVTVAEIREQWHSVLKAGARNMLDHLLAVYPAGVTCAELAEAVGLERGGGTFQSYLSSLRTQKSPASRSAWRMCSSWEPRR
jgi:hypothetical protein